jgi:hypothetical protein
MGSERVILQSLAIAIPDIVGNQLLEPVLQTDKSFIAPRPTGGRPRCRAAKPLAISEAVIPKVIRPRGTLARAIEPVVETAVNGRLRCGASANRRQERQKQSRNDILAKHWQPEFVA